VYFITIVLFNSKTTINVR